MPTDQLMQFRDPGDAFLQPRFAQPSSRLVVQLDIMVLLGPVIPDEQHLSSSSP
jgi:hypothetical protein